jgi:ankyrin repeat protein
VRATVLLAVLLVCVGASPAAQTDTPIADAAQAGNRAAVLALLEQGVEVSAAQGDGMTALHWAAKLGGSASQRPSRPVAGSDATKRPAPTAP